ncbi:MAG: autotransporter-associated beta strand repeat-containing protein [Prosthecobacter sp.]|nr:autotransporter-associated beta strand repeat-containing protein [Prosthecobacter sp.]
MTASPKPLFRLLTIIVFICFAFESVQAATFYWDFDPNAAQNQNGSGTWIEGGDPASATWTSTLGGSNATWVNGANNANLGATSNYTNNGVGGTITLGQNITLTRIDKSSQSGAYIIDPGTGYTITLTGSTPGFGNNNASAAAALTVNASVLGGSSEFLKFNTGMVILNATNTWTGGTKITAHSTSGSSSVLQIGNGGTTGTLGSGNVTFATSGSLIGAQSVLAFNRSDAVTLTQNLVSGGVSDLNKGILRQAGTGTLTVASTNAAFTGAVEVTAGTLQIGDGATSGALATTSGISISSGATLRFDRTDAVTFSAPLSGAGRVIKAGSNTLTLSGTGSTLSGDTVIESGVLQIGNDDALSTATTVNFTNAGTLDLNGFDQTVAALTVADDMIGTVIGTGSTLTTGASSMTIGGSGVTATATLDLSALDNFVFDGITQTLNVGGNHVTNDGVVTTASGMLILAQNNTITAAAVNVSNVNGGGGNHENSGTLFLGLTNHITATNFNIGGDFKNQGFVEFASGISGGTITLRGTNAEQRMDILIGRHDSNGVVVEESYLDSRTGTLDALVGNLTLGVTNNRSKSGLGRFSMGLGTLDATTIVLGQRISSSSSTAGSGASPTGTLELDGGTIIVQSMIFADKQDASDFGTVTGIFNFLSGTFRAGILQGGGGSTGVSRLLNWSSGSIEPYDNSSDLTISDITLTLNGVGDRTFNVGAGHSIAVDGPITNGGAAPTIAFTKLGAGSLLFGGAGSSHTGSIDLQEGTLQTTANHALSDNATVNFTGDTILDLQDHSDAISTLTVANGITATVQGSAGTLTLSGNTNWVIGDAVANSATVLDMSALGTFIFDRSTADIHLGSQGNLANNTVTVTLAQENQITAKSFGIATITSGATGGQNVGTVNLGQINTIHANTVTVGGLKSDTRLQYASGISSGSLQIRATDGSSRVTLLIGKGQSSSVGTTAVMDTSSGSLDALIGTLTIGQNDNSGTQGSNTMGTLLMSAGTLDATSIILGDLSNNSSNTTYTATGILTLTGPGTIKVNTLTLSQRSGTGEGFSHGIFNLQGGSLQAASIQQGTAPKGSVTFNWEGGDLQNKDSSTDLVITGVDLTLNGNGSRTFTVTGSRTATVNSSLVDGHTPGSNAFTKIGSGTLQLLASSTYTGSTSVQEGVLFVGNNTGSATGFGNIQITTNGTLSGTGIIAPQGSAGLTNDGTLKAGNIHALNAGSLTLDLSSTTGGFSSTGILAFDIFTNAGDNSAISTAADRLIITQADASDITLSGTLRLQLGTGSSLDSNNDLHEGDRWLLADWTGLTGGIPSVNFSQIDSSSLMLPTDLKWSYEANASGLYAVIITVPEPSKMAFLLLGLSITILRRRRP